MAASRASLSGLCIESPNESRIMSPETSNNGKFPALKSYDSMSETVGTFNLNHTFSNQLLHSSILKIKNNSYCYRICHNIANIPAVLMYII